jgi:hypothetical protein
MVAASGQHAAHCLLGSGRGNKAYGLSTLANSGVSGELSHELPSPAFFEQTVQMVREEELGPRSLFPVLCARCVASSIS